MTQKKNWCVYGTCFTQTLKNEETEWRLFKKEDDLLVRLTIDYFKFKENVREALSKGIKEGVYFYLTKMNYQPRENILRNKHIQTKQKNEQDLYISNFSMKRDSYSYEEELRFCTLDTNGDENDGYVVLGIDWTKFIIRATLEPRKDGDYSKEKEIIDGLSECLGKNKLYISTLYDTKETKKIEKMFYKKN